MDIRHITPDYAVSPQIDPEDLATLKAEGFTRIIANRPDAENPETHQVAAIGALAKELGLEYVINPVIGGRITMENVTAQAEAITEGVKTLAYCASGNRSSIVWALSQAGKRPTDELVALPSAHGYNIEMWRNQIDDLAKNA